MDLTIYPVLLLTLMRSCAGEATHSYNNNNGHSATQIGDLLKPPPLPLSNILPLPFHGGSGRNHRQNIDTGYQYPQPPPPPPPVQLQQNSPATDFRFPAPFYKQYNFNFLPPQPFTTTPSPSLFQKVSGWLFSSQQTPVEPSPGGYNNEDFSSKKGCNPCNSVPWIPVIRYNVGAKNFQQNVVSTYGPPSPTAYANGQNIVQFNPQPFQNNQGYGQSQISTGIPHAVYGPPKLATQGNPYVSSPISTYGAPSLSHGAPSSTYGPPSPTHTVAVPSQSPPTSTFSFPSSSFTIPSAYGIPSQTSWEPSPSYGPPSPIYGPPTSTFNTPSSTPSPLYSTPYSTSNIELTPSYEPSINNNGISLGANSEFKEVISGEMQLPKVGPPTGFKNSYGESIGPSAFDVSYPVSASAAESTKIKTEILPSDSTKTVTQNASLALANPAPFSLNKGRNIHTLQPLALPNLSVSPLPPIFNARPFRTPKFPEALVHGFKNNQQNSDRVKISQSLPLAEYTHSIEYPPTVVQSPIIDVDSFRKSNQTKAYRNIINSYVVDNIRDISSQASEDHIAATKSNQDVSFESTGSDTVNDVNENDLPSDLRGYSKLPSNHKPQFSDLRGMKDEDVDKFRTESNLQNIDSPLLYLKPSAPHKDFANFVISLSTPSINSDYEIYDEIPTTGAPQISSTTISNAWDESKNYYNEEPVPSQEQKDANEPKIVQIIVPYTSNKDSINSLDFGQINGEWEDEYQARKVPTNTENSYFNTPTESYSTTPEDTTPTAVTENYDGDQLNVNSILNDLYDVKEPPFDIVKLQHTIDGWTEQEYSKHRRFPIKTRTNGKYAKKIPDEFFTTLSPSYDVAASNYYDWFDREGKGSITRSVIRNKNVTVPKPFKDYNTILRKNSKHNTAKDDDQYENHKLHIYTAASSFRSTTTTQAPWDTIQTSISPLTKEKVYVVTSKPWRESHNVSNDWYDMDNFESKKTEKEELEDSAPDDLIYNSPRFFNRPSYAFTAMERSDSVKTDSSYAFSKSWHQKINNLDTKAQQESSSAEETSATNWVQLNGDTPSSTSTSTTSSPRNESTTENSA